MLIKVAAHVTLARKAERRETPMGDGRLVWHTWGAGEPVVLLHGGSGSWTHWVRNIESLVEAGRQVVIPDLPGFGDSDRPPQGSDADAMPPWVEAGLSALIGQRHFDLVGFSFGAMVAAFIATRLPQRVGRLVLVGAPALLSEAPPPPDLRAWNHLTDTKAQNAIHRHNLLALMLADPRKADSFTVALHSANLRRDRMTQRRLSRTDILRRTLPHIRCIVDGIWGEHDVLVRGRLDALRDSLALAPRFRSLRSIPATGHWVQYEAPLAFNAVLGRILATDE